MSSLFTTCSFHPSLSTLLLPLHINVETSCMLWLYIYLTGKISSKTRIFLVDGGERGGLVVRQGLIVWNTSVVTFCLFIHSHPLSSFIQQASSRPKLKRRIFLLGLWQPIRTLSPTLALLKKSMNWKKSYANMKVVSPKWTLLMKHFNVGTFNWPNSVMFYAIRVSFSNR